MRSFYLLAAAVCAFELDAVAATEHASMRIHNAAASDGIDAGVSSEHHHYQHDRQQHKQQQQQHTHYHHHHKQPRQLVPCVNVADEAFKNDIMSACTVRRDGFDFYYQAGNRTFRNCACESYATGVNGVNLGAELPWPSSSVQCFTKNATLSTADVVGLFDRDGVRCDATAFNSSSGTNKPVALAASVAPVVSDAPITSEPPVTPPAISKRETSS